MFITSLIPCGKFGSPYLGKATAAARAVLPIPNCACGIFVRPSEGRLEIFNMRSYITASNCTRGLYGHCRRVCTESWLGEKIPLPHRGIDPRRRAGSALCQLGYISALRIHTHAQPNFLGGVESCVPVPRLFKKVTDNGCVSSVRSFPKSPAFRVSSAYIVSYLIGTLSPVNHKGLYLS